MTGGRRRHAVRTRALAATFAAAAACARAECQLPEWPFHDRIGLPEHHVLLADLDGDGAQDLVGADGEGAGIDGAHGAGCMLLFES